LRRDLSRLASGEFDVLVVGGGVYGLITAYDAAQRGLSVALVERSDFGAATSFNHLKTIHGGLRYLQRADFARMRESIRERRVFARIAPRFVAPLAFVMPTAPSLARNKIAMRAALAVDALVGFDRSDGVDAAHRLPPGRIVAASEAEELMAGALRPPIREGAMWYDYETVLGDRLTLAFALAAADHGAELANYTQVIEPQQDGAKRWRVKAIDVLTNTEFTIRARIVVAAGGPWNSVILGRAAAPGRSPFLKAMNLVTSRPARKAAIVAAGPGRRALVLLPWQGRTLIGTSESSTERQADDQSVTAGEMLTFLAEVNETFSALNLQQHEVTLVHRGIVPAALNGARLSLRAHSSIIDHAGYGMTGLISVTGVKYTTARAVAERVVDLVMKKLGKAGVPSRTAATVLPGGRLTDADPSDPVAHAVREEMAQTLADVVIRRTGMGAAGYPGDRAVADCAARMQPLLGWSAARTASEIAAIKKFYELA